MKKSNKKLWDNIKLPKICVTRELQERRIWGVAIKNNRRDSG